MNNANKLPVQGAEVDLHGNGGLSDLSIKWDHSSISLSQEKGFVFGFTKAPTFSITNYSQHSFAKVYLGCTMPYIAKLTTQSG